MGVRNGVDIVESTVEVVPGSNGTYNVVSTVTTLEYTHVSSGFGEWLAEELRQGRIHPEPKDKGKM